MLVEHRRAEYYLLVSYVQRRVVEESDGTAVVLSLKLVKATPNSLCQWVVRLVEVGQLMLPNQIDVKELAQVILSLYQRARPQVYRGKLVLVVRDNIFIVLEDKCVKEDQLQIVKSLLLWRLLFQSGDSDDNRVLRVYEIVEVDLLQGHLLKSLELLEVLVQQIHRAYLLILE